MSDNSAAPVIVTPLLGLLGIAFVVLKLCHVIDWSWWWVTAPFWGPLALVTGFIVLFFTFTTLVAFLFPKRRRGNAPRG